MSAPSGPDVGAVREEDAFDVAAVDGWLRGAAPELELEGLPTVQQFSKGASNLTYLLGYPAHDLILRRPPAGAKIKSAHEHGARVPRSAGAAGGVSERAADGGAVRGRVGDRRGVLRDAPGRGHDPALADPGGAGVVRAAVAGALRVVHRQPRGVARHRDVDARDRRAWQGRGLRRPAGGGLVEALPRREDVERAGVSSR